MPPKIVAPSIDLQAFSCPQCGALADQSWYNVFAKRTGKGEPPLVVDDEFFERVKGMAGRLKDDSERQGHQRYVNQLDVERKGEPNLWKLKDSTWTDYELLNIHVSRCFSCGDVTIWKYKSILHPVVRYDVEPNADLPDDIRADFDEARTILDLSPRGAAALLRLCIQKLCKHLGKPGKNINDDIASLVKDGLDVGIQKALDIVRVIGNEAVHPGTLDLKDDRATAAKLFHLVNRIAYDMITHPREINALFDGLPPDKLAAIAKRDGGSQ